MSSSPRRRWLAPEVIQTSAMDCGPAALKCLLEGFGVGVSYGRLREACQTSVDGTSIDTLETLARTLGLDAEQVMMPVDNLLLPESEALPAIVPIRLPTGLTHFVVVWSVHGDFVQVMDPGRGRRWVRRAAFLRDVFVHSMPVPADAFREWAGSDAFTGPLARRMRALGLADPEGLLAPARDAPGWQPLAALDAAVRTVDALVKAGAVARGREAAALVGSLKEAPPAAHATATPAPDAEDGAPQVTMRGAVLVRVAGATPLPEAERAALPLELRTAVEEPPPRVAATILALLGVRWRWALLAVGVLLAALGTVAEAVLFRTAIDAAATSTPALAPILILLLALLLLELPLAFGLRRAGAELEERLRRLFLRKIPRLGDRYFQSRPVSDMAERAHLLHRLRTLPTLVGDVGRVALEIVVVAAALAWLYPAGAVPALVLAAAMLAIPLAAQPPLAERDLRMRNHAGALGRFYLDGLLGLTAVRTHGAEPALAREHADRLGEWVRAARGALSAALAAEATQALVGFGLAGWLLSRCLDPASAATAPGAALLVVYWALSLPALGQELALLVQQVPMQRNLTLRLLEPLGAPEEEAAGEAASAIEGPVEIVMTDVRVVAAGNQILAIDRLTIGAGEEVAIVGPSGAGKSSLVGLLLGWHRPAAGEVRVGGAPLDAARLEALRRRTVWVDPSVYLWNRPLGENLTFGLLAPPADLGPALAEAALEDVIARLPDGVATPLGEAGALVSGGEGQRVRFGRGLTREPPVLVILDEPFRGLAREQRQALLARARARWAGATFICVTHDVGETASFPRVLVIADGTVVEDAPPAALQARAESRYAGLLAAETRVRTAAWSAAAWRRLRLAGGRIVEGSDR
jgi:ATP-binding cassette subfamily B protein